MADAEPCRCMKSHAAVSPMHAGHCCFYPPTQTCHTPEFIAWSKVAGAITSRTIDLESEHG